MEIFHLVPSITRSPLHRARRRPRGRAVRGRQTAKIAPFHKRVASRRVGKRCIVLCRSDNRSAANRIKARSRKDTRMRDRYLTARERRTETSITAGRVCHPRGFFASRRQGVRAIHGTDSWSRRKPMRIRAISCLLLPARQTERSAIGNCKFSRNRNVEESLWDVDS